MLHQPLIGGVMQGTATDLSIEAKEMLKTRQEMYEIMSHHTGQTVEKIHKDCDRNLWLRSDEAVSYGVIDQVVIKAPLESAGKGKGDLARHLPGDTTETADQ